MKILVFFCFFIFSVQAEVCPDNARVVLSSSSLNQQHFIESGFLPKLFSEFIEIIRINGIKIKKEKIRDIFLQWGDDARNPHIVNLFEVSNIFGVSVSDLFKHYGNLRDFVDPSGIIAKKRPLTPEEEYIIYERIHLHLSGLIEEVLHEKNLSLKELALETRIRPVVFDDIVFNAKLPRLPFLLQILVRLDANIVNFFSRVEAGLESASSVPFKKIYKSSYKSRRNRSIEKRIVTFYETINRELEQIFESIGEQNRDSDIMRFKRMVYYRNYHESHKSSESIKFWKPNLAYIFQIARMLGIRPSEVLKYAGVLKSITKWNGLETRTLLSDEKIAELLAHVRKNLTSIFEKSGMQREELAIATQMNLRHIRDIDERGINTSYFTLELILQELGLDTIRFFEKLESEGILDVHTADMPSYLVRWKEQFDREKSDNAFIGERIIKIREFLLPFFSNHKLELAITRDIDSKTGQTFAQRNVHFKTLYKTSKVANISLSDLVGERPLDALIDFRRAMIKPTSREEIGKAQKILAHLLLSEARKQKDINGLTITELAVKSRLLTRQVKRVLSGEVAPPYSTLRQIVEDGLGIALSRFLENFENKMKAFDYIPFAPKNTLLELEGLYLSKRVKTRMKELRKRFDQALEFLQSIDIGSSELQKVTGIIKARHYGKKEGMDGLQIYTTVKLCYLLGISLRDFMGSQNFSEITKPRRLIFRRLSDERIRQAVGAIKHNIDQRRKSLGISTHDLTVMLGAWDKQKMASSLLNQSVVCFLGINISN